MERSVAQRGCARSTAAGKALLEARLGAAARSASWSWAASGAGRANGGMAGRARSSSWSARCKSLATLWRNCTVAALSVMVFCVCSYIFCMTRRFEAKQPNQCVGSRFLLTWHVDSQTDGSFARYLVAPVAFQQVPQHPPSTMPVPLPAPAAHLMGALLG